MIGKITKGKSFGGCVRYVLQEYKSQLLEAEGVNGTPEQMSADFELQTLLNDKVKNTVGHISLNFSAENGTLLRKDDELMLKITHDFMEQMDIRNTQYIIARHTDREHPHCHIVFNRVDNDGKTISDKNDHFRNERVCKKLTAKYRLHFANGKDHIKKERLRPFDRAKHTVYEILKKELSHTESWNELKDTLSKQDINMKFKVSRITKEVQGVKFEYRGFSFSGSKISREFSYMNIDNQLKENEHTNSFKSKHEMTQQPQLQHKEIATHSDLGSVLGLLNMDNSYDALQAEEQEVNKLLRKKRKAKRKRGFQL
jgi:Relaxase/Mobilisation nuclease domain.